MESIKNGRNPIEQMSEEERAQYYREVLETAMDAGHILLENGAEIARVEDTMDRISRHFGVNFGDFFVLSNGIFTTGGYEADGQFARVKHIPVRGTQLDKVVAVNALSRDIADGKYESLDQVRNRLQEIRHMPGKSRKMQVLASAVGSASFSYLFGGNLIDAAVAGVAGLVLYLFLLYVYPPNHSKIVSNILGGAIVTTICLMAYCMGVGDHLNFMIIGSIIPLVPGVPFTNGIRDIGNSDYISGGVRLLDAILVFLCIAMGVGLVFSVYHGLLGGAYL
jgi:uncharacterized membrane protein YjjP (DUF1212 family)